MEWTVVAVALIGTFTGVWAAWSQIRAKRIETEAAKPTTEATAAKVMVETATGLVTQLQLRVDELEKELQFARQRLAHLEGQEVERANREMRIESMRLELEAEREVTNSLRDRVRQLEDEVRRIDRRNE